MTLQEVVDAARYLLNEALTTNRTFPDNTSSFWTDTVLSTYHNLIQEELQNEIIQADEDHFVTQSYLSITNGTAEYSLPSGTIRIRRVEDNRNVDRPLEIYPVSLNDRGGLDPVSFRVDSQAFWQGGYYLRGAQIVLTDTPNFTNTSAIRVHYVRKLADVLSGTSTSEIPVEHHRLLVWGIVKLALFQQQSDNTLAQSEYEKHLSRMRQEIENRQTQRGRRVTRAAIGWRD